MHLPTFVVRGLDKDGHRAFYTGRAGDGWLATSEADAFGYTSLEGARNRAKNLNRMTAIHGWLFVAPVPAQAVAA